MTKLLNIHVLLKLKKNLTFETKPEFVDSNFLEVNIFYVALRWMVHVFAILTTIFRINVSNNTASTSPFV